SSPKSFLLVSATNIVNQGQLQAGAAGEVILTGSRVILRRSTVGATNIAGIGSVNGTNFTPDTAVYDLDWGKTNTPVNVFSLWDGISAQSPLFNEVNPCGTTFIGNSIGFTPTLSASITNWANTVLLIIANSVDFNTGVVNTTPVLFPSNIVHQAVFVLVPNTSIAGEIRLSP